MNTKTRMVLTFAKSGAAIPPHVIEELKQNKNIEIVKREPRRVIVLCSEINARQFTLGRKHWKSLREDSLVAARQTLKAS